MAKGSSTAYDLSLFEASKPRLHAVKSPEKAAEKREKQERSHRLGRLLYNGAVIAVLLAAVAMMIISRAQLNELNDRISGDQEQLQILQSETSRLSNELSSKTSAQSVDAYAQENGMEKVESYQIQYITVDGGDQIEVSDPAPQGLFESIGAVLAGWFGA